MIRVGKHQIDPRVVQHRPVHRLDHRVRPHGHVPRRAHHPTRRSNLPDARARPRGLVNHSKLKDTRRPVVVVVVVIRATSRRLARRRRRPTNPIDAHRSERARETAHARIDAPDFKRSSDRQTRVTRRRPRSDATWRRRSRDARTRRRIARRRRTRTDRRPSSPSRYDSMTNDERFDSIR